ncbi:hypothetical protein JYT44_00340 [Caldithrix abyssi]|nr:hypothetical protein [Caldithrix abyssi]
MSGGHNKAVDPIQLSKWIAERPFLWQLKFLDERGLATFSRERGIGFVDGHIKQLWQLCLLRADLVKSSEKLALSGLVEVGVDEMGRYLYADVRQPVKRSDGWGDALKDLDLIDSGVKLLFHPFRYYILYCLNRILGSFGHPIHVLISVEFYKQLIEDDISSFQRRSSKPDFLKKLPYWNSVTSLAIATEPCIFGSMFETLSRPVTISKESFNKMIEEHWVNIVQLYKGIEEGQIDEIRRDLCTNAEILDTNKNVHTMIRLMQGKKRLKIKGRLGGALHLIIMAEMLRRAFERVFEVELREEDELGFGIIPRDIKKAMYGSNRVLDGDRQVANEFLRSLGLDYGVGIRCYLEGYTEYGALNSVFENYNAIELINLKGGFIEKGGKRLSFRSSFRNDLNSGIFSFVMVDKDKSDNVRAVLKAAENDEICGRIFLLDPDFELENFTLFELEEIVWGIAVENGASNESREDLHRALQEAKSGDDIINFAKQAVLELSHLSKGEKWGERLVDFAWDNPEMKDENTGGTKTRLIIEAVNTAVRLATSTSDYQYYRTNYRINPKTGNLERRDA